MSDEPRQGELEFTAVREQLEKEIEGYMRGSGQSLQEVPRLSLEKGVVRFSFVPALMDKELIYDGLTVIKSNIENLRIHTFEPGYVIFQALGDNLYDTKGISVGIKFKFSTIGGVNRVEISRKANLTQDEVQACVNIFKLFHPTESRANPIRRLQALGVNVFHFEGSSDGSAAPEFIAGYEKTKTEIRESIILPLKNPEVFKDVARMTRGRDADILPKAVLFEGPPGVGKTTMARIIARETGIPMVYVPVENILSKYYGESAQNMASIFDAAYEFERVILFLDEIDSLAGSREDGMFEATRRVLSVLLRKIDGFEARAGVITIGATNRSQDLDHALLSRFDHIVTYPLPNPSERASIFGGYARHLDQASLDSLGAASEGLSGRNIQDVCEYAERRWARLLIAENRTEITAPPASLYLEVLGERAGR